MACLWTNTKTNTIDDVVYICPTRDRDGEQEGIEEQEGEKKPIIN